MGDESFKLEESYTIFQDNYISKIDKNLQDLIKSGE